MVNTKKEAYENNFLLNKISELSNTWTFVFDLNENLKRLYINDDTVKSHVQKDFQGCFSTKEWNKFQHFYHKIIYSKEHSLQELNVTLKIGADYHPLQLKGERIDNVVVIIGKKMIVESKYSMFNGLPIPIIFMDIDGVILDWNSQLESLFESLNIATFKMNEPFYLEQYHAFYESIYSLLNTLKKENEKCAETSFREDGIQLSVQAVKFENNFVIVSFKDESLLLKHEKMLKTQQQMEAVTQVAAGVAHELRNPLSVIKGFLQLSRLSNNLNKYYDTIFSEIERMNKIIEDFLSVSRKEIELHFVKPLTLMESLLMIFRSECLLHDVHFTFSINGSDSPVYVNDQMIKQVLINILRNSIEAYDKQKENRTFKLNTYNDGDFFRIELVDQGPGIPEAILSKIDQPFFTTKEKGTGIGIPLCKQIIEEHKGRFFVESEESKGTKVSLLLPIYKDRI
ncbi:histidine kinase dimerization/phospho-acceptor domain-containing protein [Evansella sp. AB-P1]|uniref:two-component system sensor histidine kinase NtrB n=1 Tax=Evansella sp. AB-P1 TaxID=3037653 RepID=UPI00241F99F6|nr:ATP-binding protein [Evansella sp. AB-P1]MDG5786574.1 histidine kinase dimerization/phospho-acceptor domain-containing protein [Evansella sp. AB-P1]